MLDVAIPKINGYSIRIEDDLKNRFSKIKIPLAEIDIISLEEKTSQSMVFTIEYSDDNNVADSNLMSIYVQGNKIVDVRLSLLMQ